MVTWRVPPIAHSGCLAVTASSSTIARMRVANPVACTRNGTVPRPGAIASSARVTPGGTTRVPTPFAPASVAPAVRASASVGAR